jgi:acetylornithine deacetylase/succinyl-diaminopimelate desuccinylase-like protein
MVLRNLARVHSSWIVFAILTLALAGGARAQSVRTDIRAWRVAHEGSILREFTTFVSLRNVAVDSADMRHNADTLIAMLERRGVAARLLELPGSPPAVFGSLVSPGATRTVMLYAHYDGQPVTPADWATPPWQPVLRLGSAEIPLPADGDTVSGEARLFARAASDDKAPIMSMLAALDALHAIGKSPSVNLEFFFEGEEEQGSPHARAMLERHKDVLDADVWIFCDGPMDQSGRAVVAFGVRGVTDVELTVYGPARALHSGHYGNWAPNPISLLASLLAGMRSPDGRVLIPGYYDDVRPLSASERSALAQLPRPDSSLRASLALGATEADDARLAERIMMPAMNFRGFVSGAVGAAAPNAIPTVARASIDFRLVPNETPEHVRAMVEAYVRRQGFFIVHDSADRATRLAHAKVIRMDWGTGYPAQRTPLDLPISRAVERLVAGGTDRPPLVIPAFGGSLPMSEFEQVLHRPLINLPTVNYDNNQHAANENTRLANLWAAIEVFGVVMANGGPVLSVTR